KWMVKLSDSFPVTSIPHHLTNYSFGKWLLMHPNGGKDWLPKCFIIYWSGTFVKMFVMWRRLYRPRIQHHATYSRGWHEAWIRISKYLNASLPRISLNRDMKMS